MTKEQCDILGAVFVELHDKAESEIGIEHTAYAACVMAEAAFLAATGGIGPSVFIAGAKASYQRALERIADAQDRLHPRN